MPADDAELVKGRAMSIGETALKFFVACETGKGWEECRAFCHDNASFSCQAAALSDVSTVADYAAWMKGIFGPLPDATYELKSFAVDHERQNVSAFAVFKASHTGEGGPVPPTGNSVSSDYVYVMEFVDGKLNHMTKIWNSNYALTALGWS